MDFNAIDADLYETPLSSTPVHAGCVVRVSLDTVRLPNGQTAEREKVWHPGGVVILPVLPNGDLLLVEQYRHGPGRVLLEFPAGKLEPNEPPAETAKRELAEETGYEASGWEALGFIYTAPGFCDEKLWLYKATGLSQLAVQPKIDDEFIRLVALSPEALGDKISSHAIEDAKTICLFHKGCHHSG